MGMDQRSVRVVVGQGDRARESLRDVLTDDGFLVVGEPRPSATWLGCCVMHSPM